MDLSITTHVSNLDDDDVDVNITSQNVTSLKIRGLELSEWICLVRVTSIVSLPLLSIVSQLIFSLASEIGANICLFYFILTSLNHSITCRSRCLFRRILISPYF